jgi:hypothetical protein
MVRRKKTREEWEREIRERQYNADPVRQLRALQHAVRDLPEGNSLIRGKRELVRAVIGLLLCTIGLAIAAVAYRGTPSVFPSPWAAVVAFGLGALIAAAGIFFAVRSIR